MGREDKVEVWPCSGAGAGVLNWHLGVFLGSPVGCGTGGSCRLTSSQTSRGLTESWMSLCLGPPSRAPKPGGCRRLEGHQVTRLKERLWLFLSH